MTRPRAALVSVADTPYYHCIGRCVRQSFLCGFDPLTGRNFDHRKALIAKRLALLSEVFAIDLCAYALMSNHYHLILRLVPSRAHGWSEHEVIERWRKLFGGPGFIEGYLAGAPLSAEERSRLDSLVPCWRQRLADLSWYMRCLNEHVARLANGEDGCAGRFWEGRFKSQALLDETALLTAMAYVDLNPVRAGQASAVSESSHTSGAQRLAQVTGGNQSVATGKPRLLPFAGTVRADVAEGIPFNLQDYLDLLDTTGRVVHPLKRGSIPETTPRLLSVLGLMPDEWFASVAALHQRFRLFIGAPPRMRSLARRRGWRWVHGIAAAGRLYGRLSR